MSGAKGDRGPWKVGDLPIKEGRRTMTVGLFSDDFEHDVLLEIRGDFEDMAQKRQYAELLAAKLNSNHDALAAKVERLERELATNLAREQATVTQLAEATGRYVNAERECEALRVDAELGRIAMKFVDRAGDHCKEDPAERICDEFNKAIGEAVTRLCWPQEAAMARLRSPPPSGGEG